MSHLLTSQLVQHQIFNQDEIKIIARNASSEQVTIAAIVGIAFEIKCSLNSGESFPKKLRSAVRRDVCQPISASRLKEIAGFHKLSDANESVDGLGYLEAKSSVCLIAECDFEMACAEADVEAMYFDTAEAARREGVSIRAIQKRKKKLSGGNSMLSRREYA